LAERLSPKQEVVGSIPAWPASGKQRRQAVRRFLSTEFGLGGHCPPDESRCKENGVSKDEKKPQPQKTNVIKRLYRETIGELRKVTWPTRQETTSLTIVVVIVLLIMSTFLGTLDFLFSQLFITLLGS
jgi:preprotein translocase subunit SecE